MARKKVVYSSSRLSMPIDKPLQQTQETVRMPLYDYDGSSTVRTGAVVNSEFGNDQIFHNLIPKKLKSSLSGENIVIAEKRQGLDLQMNVLTKSGQAGVIGCRALIGISQLSDIMVGAFYRDNGGTKTIEIYQIRPTANTVTVIGTISTVAGPPAVNVSETTDVFLSEIKQGNLAGVAVVITDKSGSSGTSAGYYALSSSGVFGAATLTKISDADFPTNQATYVHIVGPMQQMNQITYALASDGRIYNSTTDTIGTWSALGFLEAEAYPDKGVALARYKHHIMAFNQTSIEFFNDVGNDPTTGSPLERTEQAFIKFGALYAYSVINIDDVMYWIASSVNGTVGLWKLEGYAPVDISTPALRISLGGNTISKNCLALAQIILNGVSHLTISGATGHVSCIDTWYNSITTVTNEPTWAVTDADFAQICYNIKDDLWWTLGMKDVSNSANMYSAYIPSSTTPRGVYTGYVVFGSNNQSPVTSAELTLYKVLPPAVAIFQDYSVDSAGYIYYPFIYQSNVQHFGTEKKKFLHRFKIIEDKPNFTTDTNPNHVKLLLSRQAFSSAEDAIYIRTTALNTAASNAKRLFFHNCGAYRQLQFAIASKCKDAFSMMFTELDLSQGTV